MLMLVQAISLRGSQARGGSLLGKRSSANMEKILLDGRNGEEGGRELLGLDELGQRAAHLQEALDRDGIALGEDEDEDKNEDEKRCGC